MHANRKLSTQSRILIGWMLIMTLGLLLAFPFESSFAKRPSKAKEKPAAPVVEPDTSSVYDTTVSLPPPDEFVPVEVVPEMIYLEKPIYPSDAKAAGIGGEMWVKAGVDRRGVVRAVMVGKSSGSKSLDDAALAAAWRCKFKPGIQNGKPIGVWVTYKVEFKLDTSTEADSSTHTGGSAIGQQIDYDTILPPPGSTVELELQPEMIYYLQPVYPEDAKKNGISDIIWINAGVGIDGSVRTAIVDSSCGNKLLDDAALAAAQRCKYKPAIRNHRPVAAWFRYKVEFRMDR